MPRRSVSREMLEPTFTSEDAKRSAWQSRLEGLRPGSRQTAETVQPPRVMIRPSRWSTQLSLRPVRGMDSRVSPISPCYRRIRSGCSQPCPSNISRALCNARSTRWRPTGLCFLGLSGSGVQTPALTTKTLSFSRLPVGLRCAQSLNGLVRLDVPGPRFVSDPSNCMQIVRPEPGGGRSPTPLPQRFPGRFPRRF